MKLTYLIGMKKLNKGEYQKHIFCMHPGELKVKRLYMAIVKHPLEINTGLDLLSLLGDKSALYLF
jgi:hypothetical protein